jgi:YfiH family protein
MSLMPLGSALPVPGMPDGVWAWTTTRADGSFGMGSPESVGDVMDRWARLQDGLAALHIDRLATAHQVHGAIVEQHGGGWRGWLRLRGVDGHVTSTPGTALAVTIADCTPVFVAHPGGAVAALHAGWRGTAARILDVGLDALGAMGFPADECVVHLGASICGGCYEVGPEVLRAVRGIPATGKGQLDVREVLLDQARRRGIDQISVSPACTRCHSDRFFSHRGGDLGRQLGVIALQSS